MSNFDVSCKIDSKEELFEKMSRVVSYYHALELFSSSKHITLNVLERVKLLNTANCRLRELYISGIKLGDESDPYKQVFYSHFEIQKQVNGTRRI